MKKVLLTAAAAMMAVTAMAQSSIQAGRENGQAPLDKQFVIYKWYVGKVANYGKAPPRGVKNYIMLNEYGMEIKKDRPFQDGSSGNVIQVIRPSDAPNTQPAAQGQAAGSQQGSVAVREEGEGAQEGAISKAVFCDQQRKNLQTLQTKTTIYENQGNNMVPLTPAQKQERINSIQQSIQSACSPDSR